MQRYTANDFLGQLLTMDGVWIYWNYEGSYHHKGWRGLEDIPDTEVRRTLANRKHLLSVFWDCKGVIHMEALGCGQSINSDIYCQQLDRLKEAIQYNYFEHPPYSPNLAPSDFYLFSPMKSCVRS